MIKTFVAISDPVHNLIRNVTRHTPLYLRITPGQLPAVQYRIRAEVLPESYYSLAVFHSLEGLSLEAARLARGQVKPTEKSVVPELVNYFDAVKLDRRCCRDLRLKVKKKGPGMLSCELLTFGTGMLRARNDDVLDRLHLHLWRQHGRIQSLHETVYATIRTLHRNEPLLTSPVRKESFDSTNVIYGDAFGELEQLWDRRADTIFLEQVAHTLQQMRRRAEIAAFLHPPLNLESAVELHLRAQARWTKPPATARVLLRRLQYILDHTTIDHAPKTVYRGEPAQESQPWPQDTEDQEWDTDRSGYDGWLAGE